LLPRYEVYWVNTIGTRSPRLDWETVKRGTEKLRHWLRPRRSAPTASAEQRDSSPQPRVLNPKMWPWIGSSFSRRLNRMLLRRHLLPIMRALPQPPIVVTGLPIVADLIGELPVARWIYYCVDDFGQWPGLDQAALRRLDDLLIQRADMIFAVSETLQDRIRSLGRDSVLLTHGVDVAFWRGDRPSTPIAGLDQHERPLVVFWGVVDRRMDVDFLRALSARMQRGTILIVGPANDPDPALFSIPRVVHLPPLPFEALPHLGQQATVLVMPYADLPVTRAIQPLKMKEYLATGRPVVVRDLPATRPWGDCLDLAVCSTSFADLVCRKIEQGVSPEQTQARTRLQDESWEAKAALLERLGLTILDTTEKR
jgi:glycosyltransferase involved in cell wall biosynthesis